MIRRGLTTIVFLASALAIFTVIVALVEGNPWPILRTLVTGGVGSVYGLTEAVVKAIPLLLCALAAAVPGRLGLVNIGGEGQFLIGAIGATLAVRLFPSMPSLVLLVLMAFFAAMAGATWGLLPGALRALTRANETVISLLLNYVAGLMLLHLIHGPWKDPAALGWPQTTALPSSVRLTGLFGSRVHAVLWVGLVICLVLAVVDRRMVSGMSARIIGANPDVARYVGIGVALYFAAAFGIAGGIAGLGGFGELSGIQGRLREGMSLGYGYAGFFVAWLCRNRFEWLPVGAILFSVVITGAESLQVLAGMPFATVYLLQGLVFLAILGATAPGVAGCAGKPPTVRHE